VEKVRAYLATWDGEMLRPESRPFQRITSMDATVALYAPDYVYEDAVLPDHVGESYRGLDGSLRAAETWIEPFEWLVVDLDQIIDAGERVVSLHRARAKMRHTGIEFESPPGLRLHLPDDKVVHERAFVDHAEALKAVGLAEKRCRRTSTSCARSTPTGNWATSA
jgi:ketosteroid isomerase-like protein